MLAIEVGAVPGRAPTFSRNHRERGVARSAENDRHARVVLCAESLIVPASVSSNDANLSKRKGARYPISEDCRVRASILLRSSDPDTASKEWRGTLVDVSSEGAHIQINLGAVAFPGDSCVLKLAHGAVKAEVRGVLAHYVCSARHSVCGVKFDFASTGADKAYHPFFRALVASAALKGGPTDSDVAGRYREEYRAPGHTKLVVWRDDKPGGTPVGFDYTIARYAASLATAGADMLKNKEQVRFKAAPAEGVDVTKPLTEAQVADARWEFSLAASNLPATIPPDIRRFLRLLS